MNLTLSERHAAIQRLAAFGIVVSRKMNLESLSRTICRAKGQPSPNFHDHKVRAVLQFIGKAAPPQLPNFIPLRQSREMRISIARTAELYSTRGYTDRLRLTPAEK